jgi:hypothetical protein
MWTIKKCSRCHFGLSSHFDLLATLFLFYDIIRTTTYNTILKNIIFFEIWNNIICLHANKISGKKKFSIRVGCEPATYFTLETALPTELSDQNSGLRQSNTLYLSLEGKDRNLLIETRLSFHEKFTLKCDNSILFPLLYW